MRKTLNKILDFIFKKISNKIFSNILFKRNFDKIRLQNGLLFSLHLNSSLKNIKSLDDIQFKVFSRNNEDAILEYLIKSLNLEDIKFVEIGTEDYSESNTRFIYEKYNCDGLIIDNTKNLFLKVKKLFNVWKGNLQVEQKFVNKENINALIDKHFKNKNIDIFSIDIDGMDYWIINELPNDKYKIIVSEYNPYFGPDIEVTVPYSENFLRSEYHFSNLCYGMSLRALINLMHKKGYKFLGSSSSKDNAFFVKSELFNLIGITEINITNLQKYTRAKFRENRNQAGELLYNNPEENFEIIKNCEVQDLKSNKICKIKDLV